MLCWVLSNLVGTVNATHSAGADISYRCLGGLTYEVTVTFYRDCGGVAEPASIQINYRSLSANVNLTANAGKVPGYGNEITEPCLGTNTNCNGGSGTGVREWKYSTTVNLPSEQSDWVFSYSVCCRNCAITTIQSPCAATSVLYVEAKLNNLNGICNSAPVFTNKPVAYVCLGQNYSYNHGVIDQDGDSLAYSLIAPKTSALGAVNFIAPYSINNPISSSTPFSLDPLTGDLNFTPSQLQIGILAILVKEYRNGNLIGSVVRDMQIYINPCTNNLPTLTGINNSNTYSITACPDQPLCFNIQSADIDNSQLVAISTNSGIQGASYTVNNGIRPSMDFCWTPLPSDAGKTKYFTVTVKDNACPFNGTQAYSFSIEVKKGLNTESTPATCDQNNGIAWVNNSPEYSSYTWSNGATTAMIQNLSAGTYTLTVQTTDGCTLKDTLLIDNSIGLQLNTTISETCNSACNGAISFAPAGGTPPYQYNWSNGNTNAAANNLCAGNYSISISDAAGCSTLQSITLGNNSPITFTTASTNVNCTIKGSASILGNAMYSYLWSNGNTTSSINNLSAGDYFVTISDISGCDTLVHFNIIETTNPIQYTKNKTNVTCANGNNGSITILPAGNSLLTYQWNNGITGSQLLNLSAGDYIVTITNDIGCSVIDTIQITAPTPLTIQSQINNASCNHSNGNVNVQITGGTSPFTVLWSNGQIGNQINNLSKGIYSVTITDASGCLTSDSITIEDNPTFVLSLTTKPVSCFDGCDGHAIITATGNGTLNYSWSDNSGLNSAIRTNLKPGNYTVLATDSTGCEVEIQFTIANTTPIQVKTIIQPSECLNGIKGAATLMASGGAIPYTYSWNDSINSNIRKDLHPGNHEFRVTDDKGCIYTETIHIPDSSKLELESTALTICNGIKAHLFTTLNVEKDSLQWFFNSNILKGVTGKDFYTPVAGTYYIALSNACGNFKSNEIELKVSSPESIQISNDQLICPGEQTLISASGGVKYQWHQAEGLIDSIGPTITVSPLKTTTYTVTITDEQGCTAIASVTISVICDNEDIPNGFSPNNDGTNDFFVIDGITDYPGNVLYIYNRWGNLVFKQKEYDNRWNGQSNVAGSYLGQDLPEGTYYYLIDLNDNKAPTTGFVILRR